jgi:hypothetical protein
MVAVPAATPVTTPVVAFTVATEVLEDDQVPPETVEVNVVVPVPQMVWVPPKVPALAAAVTVTVTTLEPAEMVVVPLLATSLASR